MTVRMLALHAGWLLGVLPDPCADAPGRERRAAIGHPTLRIAMGVGAALLLTVGMGVAMALDLQRTWAASADSAEREARVVQPRRGVVIDAPLSPAEFEALVPEAFTN